MLWCYFWLVLLLIVLLEKTGDKLGGYKVNGGGNKFGIGGGGGKFNSFTDTLNLF